MKIVGINFIDIIDLEHSVFNTRREKGKAPMEL
jgi:hypothetical protein